MNSISSLSLDKTSQTWWTNTTCLEVLYLTFEWLIYFMNQWDGYVVSNYSFEKIWSHKLYIWMAGWFPSTTKDEMSSKCSFVECTKSSLISCNDAIHLRFLLMRCAAIFLPSYFDDWSEVPNKRVTFIIISDKFFPCFSPT